MFRLPIRLSVLLLTLASGCGDDADSDSMNKDGLCEGETCLADSGSSALDCEERDLTNCERDDDCYLLEARRIDEEAHCVGELEPVSCASSAIMGGGTLPECLVDTKGNPWWFPKGVTLRWDSYESDTCTNFRPCDE